MNYEYKNDYMYDYGFSSDGCAWNVGLSERLAILFDNKRSLNWSKHIRFPVSNARYISLTIAKNENRLETEIKPEIDKYVNPIISELRGNL